MFQNPHVMGPPERYTIRESMKVSSRAYHCCTDYFLTVMNTLRNLSVSQLEHRTQTFCASRLI